MNILYVGPYRQDNFYGLYSQAVIQDLGSKHNLKLRPIFYNSSQIQRETLPNIFPQLENQTLESYDCLIQHVALQDILYTNAFKRNIVIPIIDHEYDDGLISNKGVDEFFLDSDCENIPLPEQKVKKFELNLDFSVDKNQIFDIGPLIATRKLYFVGDYQDNIDIILSTIRSFVYLNNFLDTDISLALFVFNISAQEIQQIKEYIKKVYGVFGYKFIVDKISITPLSMNIQNILSAHNSGNIFLNLNTHACNAINSVIATSLSKEVVDFELNNDISNLYINEKPTKQWIKTYTDKSIVNSIKTHFTAKNTKQPIKHKKINNLL